MPRAGGNGNEVGGLRPDRGLAKGIVTESEDRHNGKDCIGAIGPADDVCDNHRINSGKVVGGDWNIVGTGGGSWNWAALILPLICERLGARCLDGKGHWLAEGCGLVL